MKIFKKNIRKSSREVQRIFIRTIIRNLGEKGLKENCSRQELSSGNLLE